MCLADPFSHGLLSSANTPAGTEKILAYGKSAEMESKLEIFSPACNYGYWSKPVTHWAWIERAKASFWPWNRYSSHFWRKHMGQDMSDSRPVTYAG